MDSEYVITSPLFLLLFLKAYHITLTGSLCIKSSSSFSSTQLRDTSEETKGRITKWPKNARRLSDTDDENLEMVVCSI